MLVQAVQAASDHPGPIGAFFRRLRRRKKYTGAVIATARRLVTIAYLMLKNNEPYRYAKPETVGAKLDAVRRKAGEAPRRRAASETRDGTNGAPASRLNAAYERAGLPTAQPPESWTAG